MSKLELRDCYQVAVSIALVKVMYWDCGPLMSGVLVQVIRVCGASAKTVRARMLETMMETPSLEPGWRIGSPSSSSAMHKVRSFVVLHDLEGGKGA